ncbi:MAG: hypothetical protein DWQ04_28800 [Chloroflexi bacterium]|nr:MAG: hypothetical protein DWQ04_28800 [Chloroflexota bacterium]
MAAPHASFDPQERDATFAEEVNPLPIRDNTSKSDGFRMHFDSGLSHSRQKTQNETDNFPKPVETDLSNQP